MWFLRRLDTLPVIWEICHCKADKNEEAVSVYADYLEERVFTLQGRRGKGEEDFAEYDTLKRIIRSTAGTEGDGVTADQLLLHFQLTFEKTNVVSSGGYSPEAARRPYSRNN